jgi:hypothetical protein
MEKVHVVAKKLLLIDRLSGAAVAHLRRTIRSNHEQRHSTLLRFDDRGKIISTGGPTRAQQHHGLTLPSREPKREETRGSFIKHRYRLDLRVSCESKRQRRGPRSGRNHRRPHAQPRQGFNEHAPPE